MAVWTLGINHNTAPLDVRGKFAFAMDQIAPTCGLRQSLQRTREAAIVSTCNRTEIYCAGNPTSSNHAALAGAFGGPECRCLALPHLRPEDGQAARHAFRVASGLDSMVLGEPQTWAR